MLPISQSLGAAIVGVRSHRVFSLRRKRGGLALLCLALAVMVCSEWTLAAAQSKPATTTTLAVASGGSAVTTVSSGSVVTLTASVNAGTTPVTPGQVNFCDASAQYCTDVHVLGTAQLTSAGTATMKFRPGIGSHDYKAVFPGTSTHAGSSSRASALSVTTGGGQYPAATLLSSTGSWGSYSLTATVEEFGGTAPLTGSISFQDTSNGNAVLASAPLGASTPGLFWGLQAPCMNKLSASATVVADFNGDGYLDLATLDPWDKEVQIFAYNPTQGCYQDVADYPTGNSPSAIIVADFNSDGIPDIAVPSAGQNTVTILLGHGDGTFAVSTVPAGNINTALVAADFNGDGIPDLAVADEFDLKVTILLGNGDGTFTAASSFPASNAGSLVAGDFNGDGKTDLAVTVAGGIGIFTGNGDGTFNNASTVSVPSSADILRLAAGDFNGDGKLDLALGSGVNVLPTAGQVMVLLGNGDGTFTATTPSATPEAPGQLAVADFNLDGIPDIAALDIDGTIMVLVGRGDGTFEAPPVNATPAVSDFYGGFAVGDMDGDGRPDIIYPGSYPPNSIVMYFGLTKPTETASTAPTVVDPSGVGQHLVVASYPGDANATAQTSNPVTLWGTIPATATSLALTANGSPASTVSSGTAVTLTATVTSGGTAFTVGQVNFCDATANDCIDTHLVGSASITSNGTASYKFIPGPGQHSYKAVFDKNGLGAASSSSIVALTVNAPPSVTFPTSTTIAQSGTVGNYSLTATVVGSGSTAALTGSVSFLDTSYSNKVLAAAALGATSPGLNWNSLSSTSFTNVDFLQSVVGDFNGDGIPDLAVVNQNSMTVTILLGNGDGTFKTIAGPTITAYASAIVAGDFNGDGKLDLAVSSTGPNYNSPGTLTVFLGNGDGTFTAAYNTTGLGNVFAAADFNSDGKLDLVVNQGSTSTVILLGNGDGTFAQPLSTGLQDTLAVADLNGDGIPDLVVNSGNGSQMTVCLGNGDGTFRQAGSAMSVPGVEGIGVVAVGDFNGDGIPDLAATGHYYSSPVIFLGNGDGTFSQVTSATNTGTDETFSMAVTDVNRDGKLDLVLTNGNSYSYPGYVNTYNPDFVVLLGNGDGTFTAIGANTTLGSTAYVVAADFNGDGIPELAMQAGSNLVVLQTVPSVTATATATGVAPTGVGPHMVEASYPGDANFKPSISTTTSLLVQAPAPAISPAGGTYTTIQSVTITDSVPGATIYYTTDGSTPIVNPAFYQTASPIYTGPITVQSYSETISAIAVPTGYQPSNMTQASYQLNLTPPVTPVLSLASGYYPSTQTLTIADATPGATIYYTTNGATPTTASTPYTGPITVAASETVLALATYGYTSSPTVAAQYFIGSAKNSFIYTVAGNEVFGYSGDNGPATAASLNNPVSVAIDSTGNLYVADTANNVIRRVDAKTGIITTIAGDGTPSVGGDNGPAASAQVGDPSGLALDGQGNIYVSESAYGVVRKIAAGTGIITNYAGDPRATSTGDNGPATSALLSHPQGLALDANGSLYVASGSVVRQVDAGTGIITTYAGNGAWGDTGDNGPAAKASFVQPFGLSFDNAGNLYIADSGAWVVRKVATGTTTVTTVAGKFSYQYQYGAGGDGGPATSAQLNQPSGVAFDGAGNMYIADSGNNEIRVVNAQTGIINTFAGHASTGCAGIEGDGGTAAAATVCEPKAMVFDASGNLYIAESSAARIRLVTAPVLAPSTPAPAPVFSVAAGTYINPQNVSIKDSIGGSAIYLTLDGTTPSSSGDPYRGTIAVTGSATIQALAVAPGYLPSSVTNAAYTITTPPVTVINTIAGSGNSLAPAGGGPATSTSIGSVAWVKADAAGNLYFTSQFGGYLRRFDHASGAITVIAGGGAYGAVCNGGAATSAYLGYTAGVAIDINGNIFISASSAESVGGFWFR